MKKVSVLKERELNSTMPFSDPHELTKSLVNLPSNTAHCLEILLSTGVEISVTNASLGLKASVVRGGHNDARAKV